MCGRYTYIDTKDFKRRFDLLRDNIDRMPRYNVAPGQNMPVVLNSGTPNENIAEDMKWGLIPFWSKDGTGGYKMINARAEGIASKPAYRKPIKTQRCLVPASGFYEWQKVGGKKLPYYFHLLDSDLFAFAGLYDIWRDDEGKELKTYTIITTDANEIVAPIHNRMPVILRKEFEDAWVNPGITDPAEVAPFLVPYPAELMEAYPVSPRVNKTDVDVKELLTRNSA